MVGQFYNSLKQTSYKLSAEMNYSTLKVPDHCCEDMETATYSFLFLHSVLFYFEDQKRKIPNLRSVVVTVGCLLMPRVRFGLSYSSKKQLILFNTS